MSSLNSFPRPRISSPLASPPFASSPLAGHTQSPTPFSARPIPARTPSFPSSRPLRPFASIGHVTQPSHHKGKPVKLIQPPANQRGQFVLNLTQAELSRQD
ncbi:hypothetical protein OF83DRAFT_1167657 [Amylostereum chailletii]|nr:hypothetical protein OF83DRAFT_1167657 [Amylostereum chailletii]